MEFQNLPVAPGTLPAVADLELSPVAPNYRLVRILAISLFWGILLIGLTIAVSVMFLWGRGWLMLGIFGGWTLLYVLNLILGIKGVAIKGFAIRERDIVYRTGLIWRKMITIPFNRVQHCEINQGPIEKALDLARLKIFTAGGASSDLSIPGLLPDQAQRLKEFVIRKTAADESR